MQRRYFPARRSHSILLYGFGLALALSLAFNGFLLYKQSQRQRLHEYETVSVAQAMDELAWQRELSDCQRVNQRKDSRIGGPTDCPLGTGHQNAAGSGGCCSAYAFKIIPPILTKPLEFSHASQDS